MTATNGNGMRTRTRLAPPFLVSVCLLSATFAIGQSATNPIATANQEKARQILTQTVQALGGPAWLDLRTVRTTGRTAAYFHGEPTGAVAQTTETTALATATSPARHRIDWAKGRVVQIYVGDQGWEITYRGKKDLPAAKLEAYRRWRDHSVGTALRQWLANPSTMLLDQGQILTDRRVAEKITLFSGKNDAITLEIDAATHLPLRSSFRWRDPQFHDRNLDTVEYDNYRRVDGIATPFTVTWTHNGETVRQRYLQKIEYNVALSKDSFDPDRVAAHLK